MKINLYNFIFKFVLLMLFFKNRVLNIKRENLFEKYIFNVYYFNSNILISRLLKKKICFLCNDFCRFL